MCQNQKSLIAKINSQLSLVLELTQDLNHDFSLVYKIRRFYPQLKKNFSIMEQDLSKITLFDDEDTEDFQIQGDWEAKFTKRTYSEILGIDQEETQNVILQPESNHPSIQQISSQLYADGVKRGPYRSYKTHEKLNVVRLFKQGKSYASISRSLGIPQKNIVRWCKNGVYRKQGAGRKIGDTEMESKLIQWIEKCYLQGEEITGRSIRNKAMELSTKKEFKSSKGWLKNFHRRHSIHIRYGIL